MDDASVEMEGEGEEEEEEDEEATDNDTITVGVSGRKQRNVKKQIVEEGTAEEKGALRTTPLKQPPGGAEDLPPKDMPSTGHRGRSSVRMRSAKRTPIDETPAGGTPAEQTPTQGTPSRADAKRDSSR